jgi:hypothetical protein
VLCKCRDCCPIQLPSVFVLSSGSHDELLLLGHSQHKRLFLWHTQ